MGWRITVKSDRKIENSLVDEIISAMPTELCRELPDGIKTRQEWGWASGVDVSNAKGKNIDLSGSYGCSGKIAEPFAAYFADALRAKGHQISLEFNW